MIPRMFGIMYELYWFLGRLHFTYIRIIIIIYHYHTSIICIYTYRVGKLCEIYEAYSIR